MVPDLILHGGTLITLDPARPRTEAAAISQGTLVALGTDDQILALADAGTRVVDLQGRTVVPGFNDSHCHPTNFARAYLDLQSSTSIAEILTRVADALPRVPPGAWLVGGGWDEHNLKDGRMPTRWDLDAVAARVPVVLFRNGYHSLLANSEAMRRSQIRKTTRPPTAGTVQRRESDGQLTGVFIEPGAMDLIWDHIPPSPIGERASEMEEELTRLGALGLTSVTSSKLRVSEMRAYQHLYSVCQAPLPRLNMEPWAHWRGSMDELLSFIRNQCVRSPFGGPRIRLGALKLFVDGEETAGTALLYTDRKTKATEGLPMMAPQDLNAVVSCAHDEGWSVAIHAIGDAAIDLSLDAIEAAAARSPRDDVRHAIIHATFCTPWAMERMAQLGVTAIVQPNFLWLEGDELASFVGTHHVPDFLPLRGMLDAGVRLAFSSDNLPYGPLLGIGCAVSRRTPSGAVVGEDQALSFDEALRCYTAEGAHRTGEEDRKGLLKPGYLADMVVLSEDPSAVSADSIANIEVVMAFVGGERIGPPGAS